MCSPVLNLKVIFFPLFSFLTHAETGLNDSCFGFDQDKIHLGTAVILHFLDKARLLDKGLNGDVAIMASRGGGLFLCSSNVSR